MLFVFDWVGLFHVIFIGTWGFTGSGAFQSVAGAEHQRSAAKRDVGSPRPQMSEKMVENSFSTAGWCFNLLFTFWPLLGKTIPID